MKAVKWLKDFVFDTIFPITCLNCGIEGEWICDKCAGSIAIEAQDVCLVCNKPSIGGKTCYVCKKICALDGIARFFDYDDMLVQGALKVIKYGYVKDALWPLLKVLRNHISVKFDAIGVDPRAAVFVPVPLHPRKFRLREFNQSELIARYVIQLCGGVVVNALSRRHHRPPQVELDEFDRARNVHDTFQCVRPEEVRGQYVFLVDDVTTTGATINECARALRTANPREIWGLVLAKG